MYVFLSNIGFTRRNTWFVFLWRRPDGIPGLTPHLGVVCFCVLFLNRTQPASSLVSPRGYGVANTAGKDAGDLHACIPPG